VGVEQALDFGTQGRVIAARGREIRRAAPRGVLDRRVKDLFHTHPALRRHDTALKTNIDVLVPKNMPIPI
jgi:hypothetical protein